MHYKDVARLNDADHTMWIDFGTLDPCAAGIPNCIFKLDSGSVEAVLNAVGVPGAVWGEVFPRCTRNGPDTWEGEYPLLESFPQWAEPQNQRDLITLEGMHNPTEFHMLIAAGTPLDVLKRTYAEAVVRLNSPGDWYDEIDNVCHWIDDLGWCCIFMDWAELGHAVFVAAERNRELVSVVEAKLHQIGRPTACLQRIDGRAQWIGPTVL